MGDSARDSYTPTVLDISLSGSYDRSVLRRTAPAGSMHASSRPHIILAIMFQNHICPTADFFVGDVYHPRNVMSLGERHRDFFLSFFFPSPFYFKDDQSGERWNLNIVR